MDIRIEKTERAIRTAFLALRAQKPLEKITVKELCAAAYINKSTFYAHYEDLFALSDTLEREAVDAILQDIGKAGTYSLDHAGGLCARAVHLLPPRICRRSTCCFRARRRTAWPTGSKPASRRTSSPSIPRGGKTPSCRSRFPTASTAPTGAYTKNQNFDETQLLDVIGRLAGALRALVLTADWKTHRYSHSVYGLSTSFCTILIVRKNITQIHTKHTGGTGLGCVCAI